MIDYLMKIKGIADSLGAIGELVSKQDHIMNLFTGLGAYYNAFFTAINTRDDRTLLRLFRVCSSLMSNKTPLQKQQQ